jgi:hypothetical protein
MKIRVKHKETEYVVEDNDLQNTYSLIHYNQTYIIKLIEEITNNMIKLNDNGEEKQYE